jgi:hypothetical protein
MPSSREARTRTETRRPERHLAAHFRRLAGVETFWRFPTSGLASQRGLFFGR